MRSAFSLQVSATVVLCHVKLMSGVLSLEVGEQMLCSGLCNSAATNWAVSVRKNCGQNSTGVRGKIATLGWIAGAFNRNWLVRIQSQLIGLNCWCVFCECLWGKIAVRIRLESEEKLRQNSIATPVADKSNALQCLWGKIATLSCQSQPLHTEWTLDVICV